MPSCRVVICAPLMAEVEIKVKELLGMHAPVGAGAGTAADDDE